MRTLLLSLCLVGCASAHPLPDPGQVDAGHVDADGTYDASMPPVCAPDDTACALRVTDGYPERDLCCNGRQTCFALDEGRSTVCAYSAPASACAITGQRCGEASFGRLGCCDARDACRDDTCSR